MNHTQTTKHTPTYRRFNSYGFLRLYRVNPDGTQTQIGSFAGSDAPERADERQREDAAKLAAAVLATPSPPNVPTETPLHDLTDAQLDALNTWYCDLHGLAEGHIIRSVIDGHGWSSALGEFVERETALTGGADGEIYSRKKRHSRHTDHTHNMTAQTTLAEFIAANGIRMNVERTDRNPHMDGSEKMDNWKCKLHRGASRMTVHFSKGIGHNGAEPTLEEVLDCLASDAAGVENSPTFEEFCGEYGYDTDSRKAEHTFKACLRETRSLKAFLGEHQYAVLLWSTERL